VLPPRWPRKALWWAAEKCDRALVALSMRLRISPQARMRRETTVPKGPPASIYDLMREADVAEND
jgi:hypothetical protein